MAHCEACGMELNNEQELCKNCLQNRRSMRYWYRIFNNIMDEYFPDPDKLQRRNGRFPLVAINRNGIVIDFYGERLTPPLNTANGKLKDI